LKTLAALRVRVYLSTLQNFSPRDCIYREQCFEFCRSTNQQKAKRRGLTTLAALRAQQRPGEYIYRRRRTFRRAIASSELSASNSADPRYHCEFASKSLSIRCAINANSLRYHLQSLRVRFAITANSLRHHCEFAALSLRIRCAITCNRCESAAQSLRIRSKTLWETQRGGCTNPT
jgi:hypothetical protein